MLLLLLLLLMFVGLMDLVITIGQYSHRTIIFQPHQTHSYTHAAHITDTRLPPKNESQICCGTVWFCSFVALMTVVPAIKQKITPNYCIYSGLSRCHWMMVCLGFDIISCQCFVSFAPEPFLPAIEKWKWRERKIHIREKNNYELKRIRTLRRKDKNTKNCIATRRCRASNGKRDRSRVK